MNAGRCSCCCCCCGGGGGNPKGARTLSGSAPCIAAPTPPSDATVGALGRGPIRAVPAAALVPAGPNLAPALNGDDSAVGVGAMGRVPPFGGPRIGEGAGSCCATLASAAAPGFAVGLNPGPKLTTSPVRGELRSTAGRGRCGKVAVCGPPPLLPMLPLAPRYDDSVKLEPAARGVVVVAVDAPYGWKAGTAGFPPAPVGCAAPNGPPGTDPDGAAPDMNPPGPAAPLPIPPHACCCWGCC